MPLVVESLKQLHQQQQQQQEEEEEEERGVGGAIRTATAQTKQQAVAITSAVASNKNSSQDISKQIVVVEDRPGLTFGSNNQRTEYPVLVMVKNSPFTSSELDLIKATVARNDAKVIAIPGLYIQPPYDKLLLSSSSSQGMNSNQVQGQQSSSSLLSYAAYLQQSSPFRMKPPTDDSPFYFAKEPIPAQLVLLLETVIGVSAVLAFLLIYYSKVNKIRLTASSRLHVVFVMLIGLGFIFLEITFIQKFLLLLGTPIMALTVILFSILLSSGIGAYMSGKIFSKNPYRAVIISIPILAAILLAHYTFLQNIISFSIVLPIYERIGLTFALLSPAGFLMGFQFPSITRMASESRSSHSPFSSTSSSSSSSSSYTSSPSTSMQHSLKKQHRRPSNNSNNQEDITLLWGVNVIASVIGTVLATMSSMVIGFNGNLLIGIGLYLGALASAIAALKISR
jgi:hypothetical protein